MAGRGLASALGRLSAVLFMPVRHLAGPFHRRRPALDEDTVEQERARSRLGEPWAGDERWYGGGFPPRLHNRLEPLPHGQRYFSDLVREMHGAQQRVTIAGWALTPLMAVERDGVEIKSILAEVLRDVSTHAEVYVLLWAGAPALFEPNVHVTEAVARTLHEIAPAVHCELDRTATFSHDHHQKAVTVDGRVAYVGGMDLSTYQGDRWDTELHPVRFGPNWHDVQVRLEGEVVRDVEANFWQRWDAVTGDSTQPLPAPPLDPSWNTPAQIIRTIPAGFYPFAPNGEYGIHHAILAAIRNARRFIYLENQYIWSPEVVSALCDALAREREDPFRVVLVLPAFAYTGKYDNDRHVTELRNADGGKGSFEAYAPYAGGPAAGKTGYAYSPIYVHAKVAIIDDEWFTVGSANLNGRGLATDTEMNVQAVDPAVARSLRLTLWSEHLGMTVEEIDAGDPIELIDQVWTARAREMGRCARESGPPGKGQIIRYDVKRRPISRMLDVIQDVTLEH